MHPVTRFQSDLAAVAKRMRQLLPADPQVISVAAYLDQFSAAFDAPPHEPVGVTIDGEFHTFTFPAWDRYQREHPNNDPPERVAAWQREWDEREQAQLAQMRALFHPDRLATH